MTRRRKFLEREEDLKIVREVLDYDTSTRTRIKLLKVLSPEAEEEPLLNDDLSME